MTDKKLTEQFVKLDTKTDEFDFIGHQNSTNPHPNWASSVGAALNIDFEGVDLFDGVTRQLETVYVNNAIPRNVIVVGLTTKPLWSIRIQARADSTSTWIELFHTIGDRFDPPSNDLKTGHIIIPPNWEYQVEVFTDISGGASITPPATSEMAWYEMELGADTAVAQAPTRPADVVHVIDNWDGTTHFFSHPYETVPILVTVSLRAKNSANGRGYGTGDEAPLTYYGGAGEGYAIPAMWSSVNMEFIGSTVGGAKHWAPDILNGGTFSPNGFEADWSVVLRAWFANGAPYYNVPVGTIIPFAASTAPNGYMECNGAAVSRDRYPELFSIIGETYGAGDGVTTFNLPDLRGEFLRGWDHGRGKDTSDGSTSRILGSHQPGSVLAHDNGASPLDIGSHNYYNPALSYQESTYAMGKDIFSAVSGDYPTNAQGVYSPFLSSGAPNSLSDALTGVARPTNVAVMFCIKYGEYTSDDNLSDHILSLNPHPNVPNTQDEIYKWTIPLEAWNARNEIAFPTGIDATVAIDQFFYYAERTAAADPNNGPWVEGDRVYGPDVNSNGYPIVYARKTDTNKLWVSLEVNALQLANTGNYSAGNVDYNANNPLEAACWNIVVWGVVKKGIQTDISVNLLDVTSALDEV